MLDLQHRRQTTSDICRPNPSSVGTCIAFGRLSNVRQQNTEGWTKTVIDDLWYKNAVIYCLSVGTYMDSNGDGIGDFRGLECRLDYLHGPGITAIWLMPFQTSPGKDDGYDISDYYIVEPRYGTLGDFVEFTHGCKQRGIRVIIDLVVNHTSDQHQWFREARRDRDLRWQKTPFFSLGF